MVEEWNGEKVKSEKNYSLFTSHFSLNRPPTGEPVVPTGWNQAVQAAWGQAALLIPSAGDKKCTEESRSDSEGTFANSKPAGRASVCALLGAAATGAPLVPKRRTDAQFRPSAIMSEGQQGRAQTPPEDASNPAGEALELDSQL